jgi:hypothetical protein
VTACDPRERPALPGARAFVVLLHADCDPAAEDVRGRVEHVPSGRTARFESLADLVGFLARITAGEDEPA